MVEEGVENANCVIVKDGGIMADNSMFFFFQQRTAKEIVICLEFKQVDFRSFLSSSLKSLPPPPPESY